MPAKKSSVSIVIPNWNGETLLSRNLPDVVAAANGAEIIVADDASADGSVALLKRKFPEVIIVANGTRQGFAGNVNSGVAKARGDIVVLLNSDVRPKKDFLAALLSDFADPDVAAVGCLEESHDAGGVVLRGRGVARWEKGYFIHEKGKVTRRDTAWVTGGSCAWRRDVWERLGGMDTVYNPFYWEDIDLSYQALKAGYRLVFEPKSVVGHFHEEGKIKTSFSANDVKRIAYRNQFLFLWKNMSDPGLWAEHILWTPVRLLQAVLRGDMPLITGYAAAVLMLPRAWKSRKEASRSWKKSDRDTLPGQT